VFVADYSPPSNAEVENGQELYLLSPKRLRSVVGQKERKKNRKKENL
jgi:hypothetical protein